MKFAIFLRNFDEILPEFHRNVQEMTKKVDTPYSLRKTESLNYLKVWKKAENEVSSKVTNFRYG